MSTRGTGWKGWREGCQKWKGGRADGYHCMAGRVLGEGEVMLGGEKGGRGGGGYSRQRLRGAGCLGRWNAVPPPHTQLICPTSLLNSYVSLLLVLPPPLPFCLLLTHPPVATTLPPGGPLLQAAGSGSGVARQRLAVCLPALHRHDEGPAQPNRHLHHRGSRWVAGWAGCRGMLTQEQRMILDGGGAVFFWGRGGDEPCGG